MPVFNGQRYLDEAIASIISQTYANFELIIADNCSTDDSLAIARKWQEIDDRIKVIESATNLGAAPNFNRVFAAAEGELFKWAACDDLIEPNFLQGFSFQKALTAGFSSVLTGFSNLPEAPSSHRSESSAGDGRNTV